MRDINLYEIIFNQILWENLSFLIRGKENYFQQQISWFRGIPILPWKRQWKILQSFRKRMKSSAKYLILFKFWGSVAENIFKRRGKFQISPTQSDNFNMIRLSYFMNFFRYRWALSEPQFFIEFSISWFIPSWILESLSFKLVNSRNWTGK